MERNRVNEKDTVKICVFTPEGRLMASKTSEGYNTIAEILRTARLMAQNKRLGEISVYNVDRGWWSRYKGGKRI